MRETKEELKVFLATLTEEQRQCSAYLRIEGSQLWDTLLTCTLPLRYARLKSLVANLSDVEGMKEPSKAVEAIYDLLKISGPRLPALISIIKGVVNFKSRSKNEQARFKNRQDNAREVCAHQERSAVR